MNFQDDDEAPRAKRRFEKINAKFERFSISGDDEGNKQPEMDTSDSDADDDDLADDEWFANDEFTDDKPAQVIVEEPTDEPNQLLLNDCLQRYLDLMKQTNGISIPTR
ncbi:DNA-directed RNA polymerase subunit delta domain protein [Cooperia oncophora]